MRVVDWRDVPRDAMEPFYARERERWARDLTWETAAMWEIVESARASGRAPGWLACDDDGEYAAWTFGHVAGRTLQLGGLVASTARSARAVLLGALRSPEAAASHRIQCFFWPSDPSVVPALHRERFAVQESLYLARACAVDPATALVPGCQPWSADAFADTARVLHEAYAGSHECDLFAPGGGTGAWASYLAGLVHTPGCGAFLPQQSWLVVEDGRPRAVALVTRLGPTTAHLAQLAVCRDAQGRGLGRALLGHVMARSAAAGYATLTLLVDRRNVSARALYGRCGFEYRAAFVAGAKRLRQRTRTSRDDRAVTV